MKKVQVKKIIILVLIIFIAPGCEKKNLKPKVNPENYQLTGILEGDQKAALINEEVVKVGDEIDGATVVAIEATYVQLDVQGETIKRLLPEWIQAQKEKKRKKK